MAISKIKSKLIILRGNSGSGKTTIAKSLQHHFGAGTLLVSQDTIRRDMLKVKDRDGNLSIDLIRQVAEYGNGRCGYVIVEGILSKKRYGDMLAELIDFFEGRAVSYYFDLTYEETFKRHNSRPKKTEFGEAALRSWWIPADYLGIDGEYKIPNDMTHTEIMELILTQLKE